jgi:hypothetical protein
MILPQSFEPFSITMVVVPRFTNVNWPGVHEFIFTVQSFWNHERGTRQHLEVAHVFDLERVRAINEDGPADLDRVLIADRKRLAIDIG